MGLVQSKSLNLFDCFICLWAISILQLDGTLKWNWVSNSGRERKWGGGTSGVHLCAPDWGRSPEIGFITIFRINCCPLVLIGVLFISTARLSTRCEHVTFPHYCVCVWVGVCSCVTAYCALHSPVELLFPESTRTITLTSGLERQRREDVWKKSAGTFIYPRVFLRSSFCGICTGFAVAHGPVWLNHWLDKTRRLVLQTFDCHCCFGGAGDHAELFFDETLVESGQQMRGHFETNICRDAFSSISLMG